MTGMLPSTKSGGSRVRRWESQRRLSPGDREEPQGAAEAVAMGDPGQAVLPARSTVSGRGALRGHLLLDLKH